MSGSNPGVIQPQGTPQSNVAHAELKIYLNKKLYHPETVNRAEVAMNAPDRQVFPISAG
jgi:hypothetical protein